MKRTSFARAFVFLALVVFGSLMASGQSSVNVRFPAGASSITVNGSIRGDRYVDYLVTARANQRMKIKLARRSGEPPYFNVLRKGSEVAITDDAREVTEWTGDVPSDGSYAIRVYMAKAGRLARRTSNFRLSITVDNDPRSDGAGIAKTVYYNCSSAHLRADFKDGQVPTVRIRFGTQDIELPLEPSGSGSKYEFNTQMFWVKGNNATLRSKVLDSECEVIR